jgi:hypothetical protein
MPRESKASEESIQALESFLGMSVPRCGQIESHGLPCGDIAKYQDKSGNGICRNHANEAIIAKHMNN